jgi:DNA-binding response OmpR family regulator
VADVDVHIANLRRKLDLPGSPSVIRTVRGIGYSLQP